MGYGMGTHLLWSKSVTPMSKKLYLILLAIGRKVVKKENLYGTMDIFGLELHKL